MSSSLEVKSRSKDTSWENDAPIADLLEALDLLYEGHHVYRPKHYLSTRKSPPEIHVEWYIDGDSGGGRSGTDYYQIDRAVSQQLIDGGFVTPRIEKGWGWSRRESEVLVLSEAGLTLREKLRDEQFQIAKAFLRPGVHSKWSSIFNCTGSSREKMEWGRLSFSFITPLGEKVRIYPDNGEFEMLVK